MRRLFHNIFDEGLGADDGALSTFLALPRVACRVQFPVENSKLRRTAAGRSQVRNTLSIFFLPSLSRALHCCLFSILLLCLIPYLLTAERRPQRQVLESATFGVSLKHCYGYIPSRRAVPEPNRKRLFFKLV